MLTRAAFIRAGLASLLLLACDRPPPPPVPPVPAEALDRVPPAPAASTPTAPGPTPGGIDAPTGTPGPTPGPTQLSPAPPPPPAPVEVLEAQALIPGASTPLKSGEQVTVDPGATFRVLLKGTFREARLSLLDAADAMQPSAGAREAGPFTTVTLQPAAPLRPGGSYRLRVDGATTRELKSADASIRAPVEYSILAAGEPPSEPRAKPKKAKKRP